MQSQEKLRGMKVNKLSTETEKQTIWALMEAQKEKKVVF